MHRHLCLPGGRTCTPLKPSPTPKGAPLPDDSPREALPVRPEWHGSVSITTHHRLLARTFVTTLPCLRNRPPLSPDTEAPAGPRLVLTGYNNGASTNRRRPLRYRALPQVERSSVQPPHCNAQSRFITTVLLGSSLDPRVNSIVKPRSNRS